jgi:hypothetical protein
MDNTLDALRGLYVALGGDADDVANLVIIPDLINAIATQAATALATAGASELPEVDAEDNGKVLKVADGKWSVGTDATT